MKKFRFRLEKLLNIRRQAEEDLARKLSSLGAEKRNILRELGEMGRERQGLVQTRSGLQKGELTLPLVEMNRYQIQVLERASERRLARLDEVESEIRRTREVFLERSRERKAVDKLREKRHREYLQQERQMERKELDDQPWRGSGTGIA
ncbi:MAG: hypothetical protein QGG80_05000 [Candidatus Krumholzibacteria bacterium]|jgi:flagellar FliJ protein|nr:hypothetical protein [Candidatus Krumholzibacteria bacterium]MDP6796619.1 hypothetical protein [Candidatus Krumholzibacteria bacterium]MDP7020953.1 hypothetical protein [Candidatus Krumholzibacteria bacterium]